MNAFRIILLALLFSGAAHAQSLVVVVDTSTEMPMADVRDGRLLGGIHRDLAEALAYRMGRKLAAGRVQHVATIKYFYDYQQRQREPIKVHPPLLVKQYLTRCAVSQKGRVSLADVDAVLTQLVRDGVIAKILSTYQ